jgi:tail sheath protein
MHFTLDYNFFRFLRDFTPTGEWLNNTVLYCPTMARVIPGVEVQVIKEIVPQQLYPSGVVGMVGTADKGPVGKPVTLTSFQELKEIFLQERPGSLIRDGKNAFLNGVFQVVAVRVAGGPGKPSSATLTGGRKNRDVVKLTAKDAGESVEIKVMKGATDNTVRVEILKGKEREEYENLDMNPSNPLYLVNIITQSSKWVTAESILPEPNAEFNPGPQETRIESVALAAPGKEDYEKALEALELETSIDVVCACENSDPEIHALIDAHCKNMSLGKEPKPLGPRIGVGTVAKNESVENIIKRTETLNSDRFVLVAPYGVAGSVAGLLSKLNYFESPTFKTLTGIADIERRYTPSEQMKLLSSGVLPVDAVKGRGIIVVKGITTSKEQISVMRVADHAMRGIKNVADLFIGNLNNDRNRSALRERITEFMIGMEKEGSIVPSVDKTKPAYLVDVYSSQSDFAQGIVRIDSAVRPVRAMDYIYATLNVQAF